MTLGVRSGWLTGLGILVAVALVVGLFALTPLATLLLDRPIPAEVLTNERLEHTKRRLVEYCRKEGALPASLESLPEVPGKDSGLTDGWDHDLVYVRTSDTSAFVTSEGPDGLLNTSDDITVKVVAQDHGETNR